jgi:hypothetical protein
MQRVRVVEQQLDTNLEVCIKNTEYSHLVKGYGEHVTFETEWESTLLASASYFGPRDILIYYSDYNCSMCDYPDVTIRRITEAHSAVICLKKLVEDLQQDGLFYNVDLMQPAARWLASDNYLFVIGLNLKRVRIPYMEELFIKKVSKMYELEDDVLQHIATVYANATSDEDFSRGILDSGFQDEHESLLMLRKHLLKSPEYTRKIR